METNIKQCPYCGEEILIAAKKCKHCGEWLENKDSNNNNLEVTNKSLKVEVNHLETSISDFIPLLFWIGIIAAFISLSYQCGASNFSNPRKWMQLMLWATYIPEWVADLISGFVDTIFAYALYVGMKQQAKPMSGLLITNIIITVLISISALFSNMDIIKEDDDFGMIILALTVLVTLIVSSMIGIQFIRHFNGLLNKFGWITLSSLIVVILGIILISEGELNTPNIIISIIGVGIYGYLLYIQKELLTD